MHQRTELDRLKAAGSSGSVPSARSASAVAGTGAVLSVPPPAVQQARVDLRHTLESPPGSPKPRMPVPGPPSLGPPPVEDARARLEKEKWRRVAQAAEKAAAQSMEEAEGAKQQVEDLRSTHAQLETRSPWFSDVSIGNAANVQFTID